MNPKYSTIVAFALITSLALFSCRPGQSTDSTLTPLSTVSWTPSVTSPPTSTVTPIPTSGPTPSGGGAGQIAFCRIGTPNGKIYSIDIDGANLHQLSGNTDGGGCHPAWSPDGQQIAFEGSDSDGVSQIYIMDADGSHPTALTNSRVWGEVSDPQWSPDGLKIAFYSALDEPDPDHCSYADCNYEIYTMNSDGTKVTRLTNSPTKRSARSPG